MYACKRTVPSQEVTNAYVDQSEQESRAAAQKAAASVAVLKGEISTLREKLERAGREAVERVALVEQRERDARESRESALHRLAQVGVCVCVWCVCVCVCVCAQRKKARQRQTDRQRQRQRETERHTHTSVWQASSAPPTTAVRGEPLSSPRAPAAGERHKLTVTMSPDGFPTVSVTVVPSRPVIRGTE